MTSICSWAWRFNSSLNAALHYLHFNLCSCAICFFMTPKSEQVMIQCLHFSSPFMTYSSWCTRSLWTFRLESVWKTKPCKLNLILLKLIPEIWSSNLFVFWFLWQSSNSSNSLLSYTNVLKVILLQSICLSFQLPYLSSMIVFFL